MGRHHTAVADPDVLSQETVRYTPQRPELRTRRAPRPPLWSRLCVLFGAVILLAAGAAYAVTYFLSAA
jgi:hypothetical protein